MVNLLTKSFIKINSVLWVSFIFMIVILLNGAAVDSTFNEVSILDPTRFLIYLKAHTLHLFLIFSSFFLILTANRKLMIAYLFLCGLVLFEMISRVFIDFDKYIIFNIFILFIISFYFFHVIKNELYSAYYVKNFSERLLRDDFLIQIKGKFDSRDDYTFTVTNWDVNGFFAKIDKVPDSFDQIEIQYKDIKIMLQSIEIYYFDKGQKYIGCRVKDNLWKKFNMKLESYGFEPEFIR
jgi:hypothetical protein